MTISLPTVLIEVVQLEKPSDNSEYDFKGNESGFNSHHYHSHLSLSLYWYLWKTPKIRFLSTRCGDGGLTVSESWHMKVRMKSRGTVEFPLITHTLLMKIIEKKKFPQKCDMEYEILLKAQH
ncbi:hypothetical protein RB195_012106 [Necator americanus]|uniref:Uncharacterized protein n=1 Tax=Necator americanus TaxID=51031 RepID=A0ABR1D6G8_NECAM